MFKVGSCHRHNNGFSMFCEAFSAISTLFTTALGARKSGVKARVRPVTPSVKGVDYCWLQGTRLGRAKGRGLQAMRASSATKSHQRSDLV